MSVLFFHQNARIQFSIDTNSPKTDRSTGPKISSDLPSKPNKHHLGRSLVSSSWANTLKKKSLWMRLNAQKRKPPYSGLVKICLVGYRNSILHNLLTSSGSPTSVRLNPLPISAALSFHLSLFSASSSHSGYTSACV